MPSGECLVLKRCSIVLGVSGFVGIARPGACISGTVHVAHLLQLVCLRVAVDSGFWRSQPLRKCLEFPVVIFGIPDKIYGA